jgi:hypothetical protein
MCIAVDTYYLKRSAFLAVFAIELFEDRVPNAAIGIDDERAAAFNIERFGAALDRAGLRHLGNVLGKTRGTRNWMTMLRIPPRLGLSLVPFTTI